MLLSYMTLSLRLYSLYVFTSLVLLLSEHPGLAWDNHGNMGIATESIQQADGGNVPIQHSFDVLSLYTDGLRRMFAV